MRKCSILLLFFLSVSVVSGQKNMFVFRNNAMINTFLIQQIDSMKFSSNLTVMDIYKHDQSVTKIPVSSIDSLQFSDNNLPEAELVKTLHNYTTSRTMCTVDIKNNGGCTLTERGVCWSTQKNPTIRDRKSSGGISTGQFYVQTGVLSVDSTYYIRAFARNCIGTAYSNEMVVKPTTGNITYTLDINPVTYPNEYKLIKEAMDSACVYYNRYSTFKGNIYVYYNAGIPTAQASYHGSIGFGPSTSYMWVGTAMHEIAHFLGSGTTNSWKANLVSGVWVGAKAKAVIASFGTGEVLKGDSNSNPIHFWPYGINYRSEVRSATDLIRHVKLVQAMVVEDSKVPNTW